MKVFLMADYRVGWEVAKYLRTMGENIVGLAVHPVRMEHQINRGYTRKIIETVGLPKQLVFDGEKLKNGEGIERVRALQPDVILCVFWGFLLQQELINIPTSGCINFHCAYLPYNRGKNPNIWPIIEGTPAGVTLHYIDPGIDSGDIMAQKEVMVEPIDTGKTLYEKLANAFIVLFHETWPKMKNGTVKSIPQPQGGTFHYAKDLQKLDHIDLDKLYTGRELINILRARTFPPYPGAYFLAGGEKIYMELHLKYAKGDV